MPIPRLRKRISQDISKHKPLLGLLTILFVAHVIYYLYSDPRQRYEDGYLFYGDSREYFSTAYNLLYHGNYDPGHCLFTMPSEFFERYGKPYTQLRVPLYPTMVASFILLDDLSKPEGIFNHEFKRVPRSVDAHQEVITNYDARALIGVQHILTILCSLLLYLVILDITKRAWIAFVSALMLGIEPVFFSICAGIWSDSLLVFLVSLNLFFSYRYFVLNKQKYLFLASGVLGLMTMTKVSMILVGVFFFPIVLVSILRRTSGKSKKKGRFRELVIAVAIYLAIVSPWAFRNKLLFDSWKLTPHYGFNMVSSYIPRLDVYLGGEPQPFNSGLLAIYQEAERSGVISEDAFNPFTMSDYMIDRSIKYILENHYLDEFIALHLVNAYEHFVESDPFFIWNLDNKPLLDKLQFGASALTQDEVSKLAMFNLFWQQYYLLFYGVSLLGLGYLCLNLFKVAGFKDFVINKFFFSYAGMFLLYHIVAAAPINKSRLRLPELLVIALFFALGMVLLVSKRITTKVRENFPSLVRNYRILVVLMAMNLTILYSFSALDPYLVRNGLLILFYLLATSVISLLRIKAVKTTKRNHSILSSFAMALSLMLLFFINLPDWRLVFPQSAFEYKVMVLDLTITGSCMLLGYFLFYGIYRAPGPLEDT